MPLHIADHKEGVIMEIADNGRTAPQLCWPPIPLMIIAEGTIVHHGWDVGEHPLGKQRTVRKYSQEHLRKQQQELCPHKLSPLGRPDDPSASSSAVPENAHSDGHSWDMAQEATELCPWLLESSLQTGSEIAHQTLVSDLNPPRDCHLAMIFCPRLVSGFLFRHLYLPLQLPCKLLKEKYHYTSLHVSTSAPSLP